MRVKKWYGIFRLRHVDGERRHKWDGADFLGPESRYDSKEGAENGVKQLLHLFPEAEIVIIEMYQAS